MGLLLQRHPAQTEPMISFIVPAHNEQRWIGRCLASLRDAMEKVGEPCEVIVVDDASTDATGEIARRMGARVLRVEHRKISAVRNAGARAACGEFFFFVDADTQANDRAVSAALALLRKGAAGGGCVPDLDGSVPLWGRIIHFAACVAGRLIRLVGGCFLFCTREAYLEVGGFSENLYAGEDIAFVQALKKMGRFAVPGPTVVTSARKLSVTGPWQVTALMLRIALRGPHYDSIWVRDLLYGQRARDSRKSAPDAGDNIK
jgi:glycosyltransferase involved in cell wall biosynthesis